eukprot:NODE_1155_length_1629_cov_28.727031_g1087_i0.p1 GENE.NODE_1155_length_1629_cov_28.727031_g1087_i0~~NODE_1155_length_1629_cov_28.727031_g1087_i0.p1  ORF type:complete len:531 (-),score=122.87 NODE_1155_length_1629_cov_28.727031_g1087_i0:36-1568(-)
MNLDSDKSALAADPSPRRLPPDLLAYACLLLYGVYLTVAMVLDWRRAMPLLGCSAVVGFGYWAYKCWPSESECGVSWMRRKYISGALALAVAVPALVLITLDAFTEPYRLVSLAGLLAHLAVCYGLSHNRAAIQWAPVWWGVALQVAGAMIILRTRPGMWVFGKLSDIFAAFLACSDVGAEFVFGAEFRHHFFAFSVMPVIVMFSSLISALYYFDVVGVLQVLIRGVACVMQHTMGTTACESLVTAANIFVGQTTAPLIVRPYLLTMSNSELHVIMASGFATIAGSVLGVYANMGISITHLISASVISAPAALVASKLICPPDQHAIDTTAQLAVATESSLIEALVKGAADSISLIANIIVMLIASLSLLAVLDGALSWCGGLVGFPRLSFNWLCSYVFWPFAFAMGVPWADCHRVAALLGTKTLANEFIAYSELGRLIQDNAISDHSVTIATYALCGFSNLGAIGVQIGALSAMAPTRLADISRLATSAMVAGSMACFMTACLAGVFYK